MAVVLAVLIGSGGPSGTSCTNSGDQFCADAGSARHGRIITEAATITFSVSDAGLQLVVHDHATRSQTVLDLPYPEEPMADAPRQRSDQADGSSDGEARHGRQFVQDWMPREDSNLN